MEQNRYSRQAILSEVGPEGQAKLRRFKVLIVGAGGLGSPVALYLAAAGVGKLGLIDEDRVEITNLGRQILHDADQVGSYKVDSAYRRLKAQNPDVDIALYHERFTAANAADLVRQYDFIVDGCDNFSAKFLINDSCVILGKPYSHAGVLSWGGQTFTYLPGKPCYRCLFEEPPPPEVVPNCSEAGVMGPVVGMVGCIQATEAIKCGLGKLEQLLTGALLTMDGWDMKMRKVNFPRNPRCPVCSDQARITDIREEGVKQCDLKSSDLKACIATFESSQKVLKAERFLKAEGFHVEPRVTPRQLSNECGICLEIKASPLEEVRLTLEAGSHAVVRLVELKDLR